MGITKRNSVHWGKPTLVIPRKDFLYKLVSDPLAALHAVGVSSRSWEVSTFNVELPFNLRKKDEELVNLPLTLSVPVTEVHPTKVEPLSIYVPQQFRKETLSAAA
jgi:hypothetical protein